LNRYIVIVVVFLAVVASLIFFFSNQERGETKYIYNSGRIILDEEYANSKERTTFSLDADKEEPIPQVLDLSKGSNPTQDKKNVENYETQLVKKAEKLIEGDKMIPATIVPLVETKGDFTIVFWPIPRSGKNFVPGPSRYAAVYFHKGSLDVEGVLGAH